MDPGSYGATKRSNFKISNRKVDFVTSLERSLQCNDFNINSFILRCLLKKLQVIRYIFLHQAKIGTYHHGKIGTTLKIEQNNMIWWFQFNLDIFSAFVCSSYFVAIGFTYFCMMKVQVSFFRPETFVSSFSNLILFTCKNLHWYLRQCITIPIFPCEVLML